MKLKIVALIGLIFFSKNIFAQKSEDVVVYINNYRALAISEMQRSGIPASIILAQGIHETEAGTSELVRKSNNHFGIKCKDTWTGSVVYHDDDERGECFRSYDKAEDSYKDHSDFLHASPRYAFLFKLDPTDYQSWAYGLKKAGYATNIHYSQILIKLIEDYDLQQYTLIAMGKMKQPDDMIAVAKNKNELASNTVNKRTDVNFPPAPKYPQGQFTINRTDVIFSKSGTSLLAIANQYNIPLSRLLDFNDIEQSQDVLAKDQLIFLQRKRKTSENEFHIVQNGESLYDICQTEGIRYESLLELNQLNKGMEVATGEKIYLHVMSPSRPLLATQKNNQQTFSNQNNSVASAPVTHVVQSKETLYSIAKKYGVDAEKIREWNNLDSSAVKTGQELVIYKN
ncbi:MAG TPA: glucosaminidase domain-containing protein [Puia sp.]|nr:glucosaminidase domain-containing protein [Puia sp.]